jgi:hypothetical protein
VCGSVVVLVVVALVAFDPRKMYKIYPRPCVEWGPSEAAAWPAAWPGAWPGDPQEMLPW